MESVKCDMRGFLEMTDDKGAGERPYTVHGMDDGFGVLDSRCNVVVAGEVTVFENLENAEKCETLANFAYAEGRQAERDRCLGIVRGFCPCNEEVVEIEKSVRGG